MKNVWEAGNANNPDWSWHIKYMNQIIVLYPVDRYKHVSRKRKQYTCSLLSHASPFCPSLGGVLLSPDGSVMWAHFLIHSRCVPLSISTLHLLARQEVHVPLQSSHSSKATSFISGIRPAVATGQPGQKWGRKKRGEEQRQTGIHEDRLQLGRVNRTQDCLSLPPALIMLVNAFGPCDSRTHLAQADTQQRLALLLFCSVAMSWVRR